MLVLGVLAIFLPALRDLDTVSEPDRGSGGRPSAL
jgi:hypothetical protein